MYWRRPMNVFTSALISKSAVKPFFSWVNPYFFSALKMVSKTCHTALLLLFFCLDHCTIWKIPTLIRGLKVIHKFFGFGSSIKARFHTPCQSRNFFFPLPLILCKSYTARKPDLPSVVLSKGHFTLPIKAWFFFFPSGLYVSLTLSLFVKGTERR